MTDENRPEANEDELIDPIEAEVEDPIGDETDGMLARFLDLERSAGYQVDQQARMNMEMVPQYGGTVGGVRKTNCSGR